MITAMTPYPQPVPFIGGAGLYCQLLALPLAALSSKWLQGPDLYFLTCNVSFFPPEQRAWNSKAKITLIKCSGLANNRAPGPVCDFVECGLSVCVTLGSRSKRRKIKENKITQT
jgi:hypothetical protein